jgi:hypothetical protein
MTGFEHSPTWIEARVGSFSRNGHPFASFAELASSIARLADAATAVFDGEIVRVDAKKQWSKMKVLLGKWNGTHTIRAKEHEWVEMGICLTHPAPTDCGFGLTFVPG